MLRRILILKTILLIGNIYCFLSPVLAFLVAFPVTGPYYYFIIINITLIIIFGLNISLILKTGNKLKKLQSQVAYLKELKRSKKINDAEFLLIIGNIGVILLFSFSLLTTPQFTIYLPFIIASLLNIFFIKATSSLGISLSMDPYEKSFKILLKLIKLLLLIGNIYILIYSINMLRYIQYEYEYIFVVPVIIFFSLTAYILFRIYRRK